MYLNFCAFFCYATKTSIIILCFTTRATYILVINFEDYLVGGDPSAPPLPSVCNPGRVLISVPLDQ